MAELSETLHPRIKEILEKTERSDKWVNCLDNGDGYLYKFDRYSDGTYFECIRSTDWYDATGEDEGMYLIEVGAAVLPPNSEIEENDLNDIGDIISMIICYSGVESRYGGGDSIWLESSLKDLEEDEIDDYTVIPSNQGVDDFIVDNYT